MYKVKSITPLPPADFTPEMGNYRTLQPFRYWCQKVLPLVYDDSLSYYELLCKVVDYLNKTMEDVETLHDDVTNLHTAYEQLQNYVNNYFASLDVQEEINNKLDELVQDGTLTNLLKGLIGDNSYPVFVNSTENMSNPKLIYVLSSNGHIYAYNGSSFYDTGLIYGSTNCYRPSNVMITKNNYTQYFTDVNNAEPGITYYLLLNGFDGNEIQNIPSYRDSGCLSTYNYDSSNPDGLYQIFVSHFEVFFRGESGTGTEKVWGEWLKVPFGAISPSNIQLSHASHTINDANKAIEGYIYFITGDLTEEDTANLPEYGRYGTLTTFYWSTNNPHGKYQLYCADNRMYFRTETGSGATSTWSKWLRVTMNGIMPSNTQLSHSSHTINDANEAIEGYIYLISGDLTEEDTANLPEYGRYGTLTTFYWSTNNPHGKYQLYCTDGRMYFRTETGSGVTSTWSSWKELTNQSVGDNNSGLSMFDTIVSIGDSLSCGYQQFKDGSIVSNDYKKSVFEYFKKKYGCTVYWGGASGMTTVEFLNDEYSQYESKPYVNKGLSYVKSLGAKALYVISLGTNDQSTGEQNVPIGSPDTIDDATTFYGAYNQIIKEILEIAPNAYILCVSAFVNNNIEYRVNAPQYVASLYPNNCLFINISDYVSNVQSFAVAGHYTETGYYMLASYIDYKAGSEILKQGKFIYSNTANKEATDTDIDPYELA